MENFKELNQNEILTEINGGYAGQSLSGNTAIYWDKEIGDFIHGFEHTF